MKKTKIIILLSTIAVCGTAGLIYYFYRRNKTLLNQVKELKRQKWADNNLTNTENSECVLPDTKSSVSVNTINSLRWLIYTTIHMNKQPLLSYN